MSDKFKMKDGRTITIDFNDIDSIMSVDKKDWREVKNILDNYLEIVCSKMNGSDVFKLFKNNLWK